MLTSLHRGHPSGVVRFRCLALVALVPPGKVEVAAVSAKKIHSLVEASRSFSNSFG